MGASIMQRRATTGEVVLAATLLVGILLIAHGYFRESRIELYVGLAVTASAVVAGVVHTVLRPGR